MSRNIGWRYALFYTLNWSRSVKRMTGPHIHSLSLSECNSESFSLVIILRIVSFSASTMIFASNTIRRLVIAALMLRMIRSIIDWFAMIIRGRGVFIRMSPRVMSARRVSRAFIIVIRLSSLRLVLGERSFWVTLSILGFQYTIFLISISRLVTMIWFIFLFYPIILIVLVLVVILVLSVIVIVILFSIFIIVFSLIPLLFILLILIYCSLSRGLVYRSIKLILGPWIMRRIESAVSLRDRSSSSTWMMRMRTIRS